IFCLQQLVLHGHVDEGHEAIVEVDGRYYEKGGSGRVLGEGHRVAEGSQALGVIAREAVRVEAIEVVAAQLAIRLAVAEHVIRDDEDAVGDRDEGLLVAAALDEAPVLRREVAVAGADGAAGALDERRAQRPVGEAGAAAQPLPGTLVVAGAEAGPRRRMAGGTQDRHPAPPARSSRAGPCAASVAE